MNLDRINPIKRDIVADILSKVDGYPYLKKMVIFGSSIRNDCRKDSDIDIALEWTEDCLDEDYLYKPFVNPLTLPMPKGGGFLLPAKCIG